MNILLTLHGAGVEKVGVELTEESDGTAVEEADVLFGSQLELEEVGAFFDSQLGKDSCNGTDWLDILVELDCGMFVVL